MTAANLDTSVLVDYLLFRMAERLGLEGLRDDISEPDTTASLFEDGTQQLVIGGKVNDEFDALCDRHGAVYDDMLDWVTQNPEIPLTEYDLSNRSVQTTNNDTGVLRIQIEQQLRGLSTREQLSQFRRVKQAVETIERGIRERLDETYDQFDDPDLETELSGLGLDHDVAVVVDAVEIADRDGIDLLVSVDDGITDNESELNSRIQRAGHTVSLRVDPPSGV